MATVRVLYFARLREVFASANEELVLPAGVGDVAGLLVVLRARGGVWAEELAPGRPFRVAVGQDMAELATAIRDGDEVAVFPPVTGG